MYNPNDKFFIIDEKNKIIASSNNMLELRIQCHNMNNRIGGNCKVVKKFELENMQ